jgi:hypothetical protein
MRLTAAIQTMLCVVATTLALGSAADATLIRTFINAQTGNDTNAPNCIVTTPCRTLATAYANTQAGGEIVMMTPGGYGCVTITSTVSLVGVDGATVTATSGACIVITASATDRVYIRNLQALGGNVGGTIGIQVNTGQLVLQNSSMKYLGTGLVVGNNSTTAHADVIHSEFIGDTIGITTNGPGTDTSVGNAPFQNSQTLVRLNGVNVVDSTTAFNMLNAAADGGQNCKYTFWMLTSSEFNVTGLNGNTNYFTWAPKNPPFNCGVQTYSQNQAPN